MRNIFRWKLIKTHFSVRSFGMAEHGASFIPAERSFSMKRSEIVGH